MPDNLDLKNKIHFLTRYYIESDEKLKALLLLSGALICTVGCAYLDTASMYARISFSDSLNVIDKAETTAALIDLSKICIYQLIVEQLKNISSINSA